MEGFQKIKLKPPDIHPIYKCAKFQHDWAIFDFSRLLWSFREKRLPRYQKRSTEVENKTLNDFIERNI